MVFTGVSPKKFIRITIATAASHDGYRRSLRSREAAGARSDVRRITTHDQWRHRLVEREHECRGRLCHDRAVRRLAADERSMRPCQRCWGKRGKEDGNEPEAAGGGARHMLSDLVQRGAVRVPGEATAAGPAPVLDSPPPILRQPESQSSGVRPSRIPA